MRETHWTDEELVSRLYGVGAEDGHLAMCPDCARRWEAMQGRFASLRPAEIEVPAEFLTAQRRAIHARLSGKRRSFSRMLVPALATLLLAVVVILYRPAPEMTPSVDKISDAQLFDDVFSRISDPAPTAVGAIRSLFEEQK
jgi:hypothetical protein